jgi:two-component system LytT family response regulator
VTVRAVIVDDEKPARDRLRRLLADHQDFVVVGEAVSAPSAVELIDREHPDLVFLDVQIPEGDGFEVLRRVSRVPHVIFTTAHDEYAVDAFEVRSLDYLLKPFSRQRFGAALDRARQALKRPAEPSVEVLRLLEEIRAGLPRSENAAGGGAPPPSAPAPPVRVPARRGSKILLLDPTDVFWFEAEETVVYAKTQEGRFLVDRTLAELEDLLTPSFFRSHRRYLVSLSRIGEILPGDAGTYRIVIRDDARTPLPLSRRQAQRLRELIPW